MTEADVSVSGEPDPSQSAMPDNDAMMAEHQRSMERIFDLAAEVGDLTLPIPACPAWDVRGIVSHLVGTAAFIASREPLPEDVQGWIDSEVASRSDRSLPSLVDEWKVAWPKVRAVMDGQPAGGMVIDTVTHEHDLRAAIGPEATEHECGLYAVLPALIEYVRNLDLFAGTDGVRLLTPTASVRFGGPKIGLEARLADDWELSRLLACRRSASQIDAIPADGNRDLLYTLVSRYPLPEWPLDL